MAVAERRHPTLGPAVGLAVTGPLGAWLAARALAAGKVLSTGAVDVGDLADVVSVLLLWAGCAAAAWYFATCTAVVAALLARTVGAGTAGLERAVRRWGFPLLRRTLLSTMAAGASLSLSVGAAGAAQSAHEAPLPQDLGWGASTPSTPPPVGAQLGAAIRTTADGPAGGETSPSPASTSPPTTAPPPLAATTEEPAARTSATAEPSARSGRDSPSAHAAPRGTSAPTTAERATTPALAPPAAGQAPSDPSAGGPSEGSPSTGSPSAGSPSAGSASGGQRSTYLVQPGDSLWSIAEAHLGPAPADADVALAWPRWYAANRSDVGPDPHLIHPGQLLHVPDEEAS
ncbi:LysM domain-containing protein [Georgenia soli]|uniref:LysM domain-containing protein n=1 Tax=Georgenia soli TaxID=638953 RepID=A0A2A9ENV3_9MICO|nr:LysM peptidoglycan-binding domain-containing protein [Georgenia soli]PFG40644.1 LysM domain-containing protein [Georgenia soli]